MFHERIEVAIVVQESIPALNAACRNDRVDRFANGHPEIAQRSKISRRLKCDFRPAETYRLQRTEQLSGLAEIPFRGEALQHFDEDQIAHGQRFAAEEELEFPGLRRDCAPEVIDPDA